jgi:hypothetical protein
MAVQRVSTATNLQGINTNFVNNVPGYFNNLNIPQVTVSADTDDALVAFFQEYVTDPAAANNLAGTVIYTATLQGIDPVSLIPVFRQLNAGQLTAYLVAFLNLNRLGTSLLGLKSDPNVSVYVQRAIVGF